MNIDRPGSFRGDILDRGVSTTTNGYPQLVIQLRATEKYNEEGEVWEPWNYEECEATGYICLFGGNGKPTLGVQQAMKALNWDGAALMSLQTDTTVEKIQWRMESNTYQEKTRIQVAWIDAYDAEPGRKVKKLDPGDIRKLDAKYSAALKAIGGGPKPASAKPSAPKPAAPKGSLGDNSPDPTPSPSGTPTPTPVAIPTASESAEPPFTPDPTPASAPATTVAGIPAAVAAEPEKPKRGRKPSVPAAPKAPATAGPIDQAAAWEQAYNNAHDRGKTDVQIQQAWVAVVSEAGGDEKVGADWSGVRDAVIQKV